MACRFNNITVSTKEGRMPCWVDQVKLAAQEMHVREHECTIDIYIM